MVQYGAEELLLKADRRALRALSPTARCVVLALRFLNGRLDPSELRARIEGYGVPCRSLSAALGMLERHGFVSCVGEACSLTAPGEALAEALNSIIGSMRAFAYKVLEGEFSEGDVVAELVTATASVVGFVEAYVEEPSAGLLYFFLHVYVSALSASVLAELARVNAVVLDAVSRVFALES